MAASDNMQEKLSELASNRGATIWLGIVMGTALGLGIALSRRQKKSRWQMARKLTDRVSEHSGDLAELTGALAGRVRNIFEESCKVLEDANHLWANGRKLVRH